jgi:thiamine kinase-like enzyme
LVTAGWLAAALPALVEAERSCSIDGDAVTHWDIRSDNMAFTEDGLKLIDWSETCLSNPDPDLGFWLPSLCFEGGPPPEAILPQAPEVAAWVSGFFASLAGLPDIPDAPFVRRVQREQLSTALPWAQRALRLPPLDG